MINNTIFTERRRNQMLRVAFIAIAVTVTVWTTSNSSWCTSQSCRWSCAVAAFSPSLKCTTSRTRNHDAAWSSPFRLYSETTPSLSDDGGGGDDATATTILTPPRPSEMKLSEIKAELKERNTSFADCFDRESLEKRLFEARENCAAGGVLPQREVVVNDDVSTTTTATTQSESNDEEFDRHSTLTQLRSLRVKDLKIQLSELKVRWGAMIEKEEMVQALCNALEERYHASKNFSRSGKLVPGIVADVDENVLLQELGWLESDVNRGIITTPPASSSTSPPGAHPPILLDVYATWCGPCKFLAPILEKVAEEVGPTVRVMKLDSDKNPRLSSVLKVGGLPTLIRLDGGDVSKEIQRVEGALTKDQLIDFVNGNFNR